MNTSWMKTVLIISLGLNCMLGGAFVYRFVWGRPLAHLFGDSRSGRIGEFFRSLPPESRAAHKQLRQDMRAERRQTAKIRSGLMDLLAAPEPDRRRIDEQLDLINKRHAHMERMAVEQMLRDIQALPPEKRAAFIEAMRQSRYFRMGRGPGRGVHGKGRGRGRHR